MTEVSFTSTFRVPISQAGVNSAKKDKLRQLIQSYPNGLIGKSKGGYARVSMPDNEDSNFIRKLKGIGYKIYQQFEGENISSENLDRYIKERLDTRNYNQLGKNKKRMSTEQKLQNRYRKSFDDGVQKQEPQQEQIVPKVEAEDTYKARIRNSQDYLEMKEEYGEAFAEAVYFRKFNK